MAYRPDASPFGRNFLVSQDGRVWFTNESIVQVIDPARLNELSPSSPTFIESVSADRRTMAANGEVKVPANTHDLQIDYTSIDLTNTDRMVFRYRLAPYDRDWVDCSLRRTAFYTGVPPGHYTFQVSAKPPHGDWSSSPASIELDVLPAFYQTIWFRLIAACTLLLTLFAVFQLRIHYATLGMQRRMDAQMSERIRIARELHDTILQGFYGMLMRVQSAANRLAGSDPARLAIEESLDEAETTLREGRETIRELRGEANNQEDLLNALQAMAAGMAPKGTEEVSYRVTGEKRRLHPLVRSEMLRIAREALWNALSHAAAARVEVVIAIDPKGLTLSVSDDGIGMEAETVIRGSRDGHWGLRGMRERSEAIGATFQISSALHVGTRVTLHVPASLAFAQPSGTSDVLPTN